MYLLKTSSEITKKKGERENQKKKETNEKVKKRENYMIIRLNEKAPEPYIMLLWSLVKMNETFQAASMRTKRARFKKKMSSEIWYLYMLDSFVKTQFPSEF